MNGLVLWYNPTAQVGMVWCEDQGPLAFIGPEASMTGGDETLSSGDQVTFTVEMREDVRYVRDIYHVTPGVASSDPRDIIMGQYRGDFAEARLSIVA
ncbi:hypothetical protein [Sinisalibacter aestuarii]|uniref:Cold shock domain-containing protein n=1 Tax=Sinisalibacter aestuarii TaxID=2949426 RepID=A0ABQ5LVP5_9RHOB|nr:hypothetical protein [Sinisalibacter aestuarii]GKY88959.1 hypothetical protein STA1M1_28280 [Sinisalibacter aestuarii]